MSAVAEEQRPVVVRVRYPLEDSGRIVLRTDENWDQDVEPVEASPDRQGWTFHLCPSGSHCYFKPVLERDGELHWAQGRDILALARATRPVEAYPHFLDDDGCSACALQEMIDGDHQRIHAYRIFTPPGYHENTLRRYPVLYMQDGQNLFFPQEAFGGHHWQVTETLGVLSAMNAVEPVIAVGVYPAKRMADYTKPGYEAYGRFLVERLKPTIDGKFRTLPGPEHTAAMGSSLGGVVSFYLAWEHPETFGMAACMSSTFGWRDDLADRVGREPKRDIRIYLDSGWPADNYEGTRNMRAQLVSHGYREGMEMMYLAFPNAAHNEQAWAIRAHVPFQYLFGRRPLPAAVSATTSRVTEAQQLTSDHYMG